MGAETHKLPSCRKVDCSEAWLTNQCLQMLWPTLIFSFGHVFPLPTQCQLLALCHEVGATKMECQPQQQTYVFTSLHWNRKSWLPTCVSLFRNAPCICTVYLDWYVLISNCKQCGCFSFVKRLCASGRAPSHRLYSSQLAMSTNLKTHENTMKSKSISPKTNRKSKNALKYVEITTCFYKPSLSLSWFPDQWGPGEYNPVAAGQRQRKVFISNLPMISSKHLPPGSVRIFEDFLEVGNPVASPLSCEYW